MDPLEGIWRLIDSKEWIDDVASARPPYGVNPMGTFCFSQGRSLVVLYSGDPDDGTPQQRNYTSYGGAYKFDGTTLDTLVDVSPEPARIGKHQLRAVTMLSADRMMLRPPPRPNSQGMQRRELTWERVWCPAS